jgi:drug/metabolite transporter (DMT)-like permease
MMRAVLPEISSLLVVLMWASTFVITKDAFNDIEPLAFIFARFLAVSVIALTVLAVRGRRSGWGRYWSVRREDWPAFIAAGMTGYAVYQIGFTLGLAHTSAFSSSLMISMIPLFSLAIVAFRGEHLPLATWMGVGVSLVGVVIFLAERGGDSGMLGNVLSLGAAASFALYGIVNRSLVSVYPPETVAAFTTVIGTVPLLIIGAPAAMREEWSALPVSTWLMLAYMAIFPVYLAYILWNWAIGQRGVAATSWNLLVPIVSGALSAIVFSEAFGPLKILGGALAITGLLVMQTRRQRLRHA